jgi:hypothetical protein
MLWLKGILEKRFGNFSDSLLPNVKDEPRPRLARSVRQHDP